MNQKKMGLSAIYLVVFLDMLGFGTIIPIIRDLTIELCGKSGIIGHEELFSGILMATYSFFQLLTAPILGRLSDRYGRKKLLIASVAGNVVSYALWVISGNFWIFWISRVVSGATGGNISVAQSYIADITEGKERAKAMGMFGAMLGLGFIVGPGIAGILSQVQPPDYFQSIMLNKFSMIGFFTMILSIINLIWLMTAVKEPLKRRLQDSLKRLLTPKAMLSELQRPEIGRLFMVYFFTQISFVHFEWTFAWELLRNYQMNAAQTGYFFAFMGVIMVIIQGGIYRQLVKKYSMRTLALRGIYISIAGMLILPALPAILGQFSLPASSLVGIIFLGGIVSMLSYGMGIGGPSLTTMASFFGGEKEQGTTLGIMQSFGSMARIVSPLVASWMYSQNMSLPFLSASLFLVAASYFAVKLPKKADK